MATLNKIPTRALGKNGPQVPSLGFGLMQLSMGYGADPSEESERLKVLDRAWDLGATFWDTAAGYDDNELLIGKWFGLHPERRTDIFLATKFGLGLKYDEDGKPGMAIDSTPANCRASCERSLTRLGVQSIDLFYVHRFDRFTPVEKTMDAMLELKGEGKVKNIGLSECSSSTLRRAYSIHPIAAVQIEYNPWSLDIEAEPGTYLLRTCRELGVAIVAYSPLGRGFLTGQVKSLADFSPNDQRHRLPRFSPENFAKNLDLVKIFEDLAAEKKCTPAQVVLAWILAQGEDFFPIPGTRKVANLEQNCKAVDVKISSAEDKELRAALVAMGGASGTKNLVGANCFADTLAL